MPGFVDMNRFKEEFSSLMKRIVKSKDNIAFLMLVYFPRLVILNALILLIQFVLNKIGVDYTLLDILTKLLLMVSPLYPTMKVWECRYEFGGSEGITDGIIDACIGIWFVLIIVASVI